MKAEVFLTVSECKRLIAKGVAKSDIIQEKMDKGIIVVTPGSTNAYIYEELTGQKIDLHAYVTGRSTPVKNPPRWQAQPLPNLVLIDGKPAPELDRFTALEKMQEGDIYIKGANALNYTRGLAGISIGHPQGGTIGAALGAIMGKKLRLLIPVGLEKEVPFDIEQASALVSEPDDRQGAILALWPVYGDIFTEIEAIETLCEVEAFPVAAGGVGGGEGGLRLLLIGSQEAIAQALALVGSIQGEPAL